MRLFDTHSHVNEQSFDNDRVEMLSRAAAAGVEHVVSLGTGLDTSRACVALADQYPMIVAAVGVHPNYILQAAAGDWEQICELACLPRVVAIGETGLDCYWKDSPLDQQRVWLQRHFDLAAELGKPVVLHCRDAETPMLEELATAVSRHGSRLRGIMHSFTGGPETARQCLEFGFYLSFAGMVTYKRSEELRSLVPTLPRDRLLIETDSPYLPAQPMRGKRNEPAFVRYTLDCMAELLGMSPEECGDLTTRNAEAVFGISAASAVTGH